MKTNGPSNWLYHWRKRSDPGGELDFESLTRPHVGGLWRTALRMTGDRDAADDLTQEACLKAYRAFDSFERDSNYRAWIFRILTNLCVDYLRRRSRSPIVTDVDFDTAVIGFRQTSSEPEAEVRLIRNEFQNAVLQALQKLTPETRLVVTLALLQERSYREIAEIANCPIGTVRSRLSRGRSQLRQELKPFLTGDATPPGAAQFEEGDK